MGQKSSLALLFGGLGTFFTSLGTFLLGHKVWDTILTPEAVGHIFLIAGSFAATLFGALSYQMNPPQLGSVSDTKLNEIRGEKNDV